MNVVNTVARAFRRLARPLAAYYGITLVLPLANGAARSGAPFVEHALVVLVVPPALILLGCVVYAAGGAWRKKAIVSSADTGCVTPWPS